MKTAITILFGKLEEIKAELAEIGKNEEGLNEEGLKPTMTVEELASFLNISLSHAYQQLGFSIPARRVGRRWLSAGRRYIGGLITRQRRGKIPNDSE